MLDNRLLQRVKGLNWNDIASFFATKMYHWKKGVKLLANEGFSQKILSSGSEKYKKNDQHEKLKKIRGKPEDSIKG